MQPQKELKYSMDIIIRPPAVINLDDDDEVFNIDEQVHNEMNVLFSSSMKLNENSSMKRVELGDYPSSTLFIVPLASCSPFLYDEQDWEANELL
jgi:hypothetical protein